MRSRSLFFALLLAAAPLLADDERFVVQVSRELSSRGGPISVDHRFGSIHLSTDPGSKVVVKATIRSSDPDIGKQIRIVTEEAGGGVEIRTVYPSLRSHGHLSFSVDYRISVPANAPVRIKNRFGSIEVDGIAGPSEIVNAHGSIRLRDARGPQNVENSFGSIDVSDVAGDVAVVNANGSIRVKTAGGNVNVTNRFGSVTVSDVARTTTIKNANGSVDVRDTKGPVAITNSFASVRLSDIGGGATVDSQYGEVTAREIHGSFSVEAQFGTVRAEDIAGAATVVNANGAVHLTGVATDARVRTTFASVFLKHIGGKVDVENQNGAISVSDPPGGPCRDIVLRTNFSAIKVELPSEAGYSVRARTSFGQISSDVPITTTSMGGQAVVGTIGRGGCKLELTNANGNITIGKK